MSQAYADAEPAEAVRVRQASASTTDAPGTLLRALAHDPRTTVRAALAINPANPPQIDRLLADDPDERVRTLLARKLAGLLPRLPAARRDSAGEQARATLERLVADEAVRVRAAIADAVKAMADAPHELILRLARDSVVVVSEPVIRLSPLLTPEDLLGLLAHPPTPATSRAIAGRPNLESGICDAIAATADPAVIAEMLANPSAAIREATLDALVDQARENTAWHEPLMRRPSLSPRAARALSEMVTSQLLEQLALRADLPADLRFEVRRRLLGDAPPDAGAALTPAAALARATAMATAGTLDEAGLLGRAEAGDALMCAAMLAVGAAVPVELVERAMALRSAKGITSLVHEAGWSMRASVVLQTLLGKIAPGMVMVSGPAGAFPLTVEEMRWQLDLLRRKRR